MRLFTGPRGSYQTMPASKCHRRISTRTTSSSCLLPKISSFEEERQEALASVLHALATEAPDPDRTAACLHLLRHLTKPVRAAAHQ
jgi:hypothetical protein